MVAKIPKLKMIHSISGITTQYLVQKEKTTLQNTVPIIEGV